MFENGLAKIGVICLEIDRMIIRSQLNDLYESNNFRV